MILIHNNTGREFEFVKEYKPQFSNKYFVRLLNLKTNRIEEFQADTYLKYFTFKD
jgi:3'-phosphoadenosine 5'-phosphosulfate sulfotransferase (PAPS reductase)/FAD synthetase